MVLYQVENEANRVDMSQPGILTFCVRRIWPQPEAAWRLLTPWSWAEALLRRWACAKLDGVAARGGECPDHCVVSPFRSQTGSGEAHSSRFFPLIWKLKFFNVEREVQGDLDRILHWVLAVVDVDIRLQLKAVAHDLLAPLRE